MKASMPKIVGNRSLCDRLCSDILNKTAAHAYILSGPKGSGKHLIAMQFAAAIACEKKDDANPPLPCGACPTCKKILAGKSPDITIISKSGASVKIEQIRNLLSEVARLPNDLDDKFYIIEDADTMTAQAQNAFLLTLEEPPSFVHFFLLCEKPERLLETVRSRAPVLRTEMIEREAILEWICQNGGAAASLLSSKPNEFDEILAIANGSIGRVLTLSDEKERAPLLAHRREAELLIHNALNQQRKDLAMQVAAFPSKQEELLPILVCAQSAIRDLTALKGSENAPLVFYTDRTAALELAYSSTLHILYKIYDALENAINNLSRNANIRLTLATMAAEF